MELICTCEFFQKAEIVLKTARAISTFWKIHLWKSVPNWTRNRLIAFSNRVFYWSCSGYNWAKLKIFTKRKAKKLAFIWSRWRPKNQKNTHFFLFFYLGARSCDVMYRVWESKSKLEFFYRLFVELVCHIVFSFERSLKLLPRIPKWFNAFQGLKMFLFFSGLLASFFVHTRLIMTSGRQWYRALLSLKNCNKPTIFSHRREENRFKTHSWDQNSKRKKKLDWTGLENGTERHCCLGIWQVALKHHWEMNDMLFFIWL